MNMALALRVSHYSGTTEAKRGCFRWRLPSLQLCRQSLRLPFFSFSLATSRSCVPATVADRNGTLSPLDGLSKAFDFFFHAAMLLSTPPTRHSSHRTCIRAPVLRPFSVGASDAQLHLQKPYGTCSSCAQRGRSTKVLSCETAMRVCVWRDRYTSISGMASEVVRQCCAFSKTTNMHSPPQSEICVRMWCGPQMCSTPTPQDHMIVYHSRWNGTKLTVGVHIRSTRLVGVWVGAAVVGGCTRLIDV